MNDTTTFETCHIKGIIIVKPRVFHDERGFFYESYNHDIFQKGGIPDHFIQDNHAQSAKAVLRGMHFQKPPHAQAKLVRVTRGSVYDVVVDIRTHSDTFGSWFGIKLSDKNKFMMYIPVGFAHGYYVHEPQTEFQYKCTDFYVKETEGGIIFNDPDIKISWPFDQEPIVSEKDQAYPQLKKIHSPF